MALEAEEDLPIVATANLMEAEVATEHRRTEELLVMALPTCINKPRMAAVATHSSSLNMVFPRKVFQNQAVAIVRRVLVRACKMLTFASRIRRPSTVCQLPEWSSAAAAAPSARRRSLLSKSNKAAADSHPMFSRYPTERGLEPFQSRVIEE
jgi:hypothetical protein